MIFQEKKINSKKNQLIGQMLIWSSNVIKKKTVYDAKRIFIGCLTTEQPISGLDIFLAASQAHGDFMNALLILLGSNSVLCQRETLFVD